MKQNKRFIFLLSMMLGLGATGFAQSDSLSLIQEAASTVDSTEQSIVVDHSEAMPITDSAMVTAVEDETEPYPLKLSGFVAPGALMIYGLSIYGHNGLYSSYYIHQDLNSLFPNFYTPADDYIQFIPVVAAYATGFIPGTKPRHSNSRRLWMFIQAQVLTSVGVMALKYYTHELRPNGNDYHSFPSGHTTQAFMGAALFDLEYPGQLKGLKIGLYSLAGVTGVLAALNNRHWASDVLFGAGMGILSVRLLYWSEQHWKKKKHAVR